MNLFVTPLLFLLLMLPISLAGIGVRESAFVVLYGGFGVPPASALVVSFCNFFSVLLANAFGAVLFPPHGPRLRQDADRPSDVRQVGRK